MDVISRYCAICKRPIENFNVRKRYCDRHSPIPATPKPVTTSTGYISFEVGIDTVNKIDAIIEKLGYKNRASFMRTLVDRVLLEHEEDSCET